MSEASFLNYGPTYQYKLIALLLSDESFLIQIGDIISPSYFTTTGLKWIVNKICSYYHTYSNCASAEFFKIELLKDQDILETLIIDDINNLLREINTHRECSDKEYIKTQALDFCKNQELRKAIADSIEFLKEDKFEDIRISIEKALKAGNKRDIGHDYNKEIQVRYDEKVRNVRETPWSVINGLTNGGFGKGELVIVAAPPGIGKTWILVSVGAHAVLNGLNVLHYTLELSDIYTGLRYDTKFTGIPLSQLKEERNYVEDVVQKLPGKLLIVSYPNNSIGVLGLKSHIEQCKNQGFIPDLIIVDYADLLRGHNKEKRLELDDIYKDLRSLAGQIKCPLWTASQINREGFGEKIIQGNRLAESFNKLMIADFVMSISRRLEEKESNAGIVHIIKNRFGADGFTYNAAIDTATGQFHIGDSKIEHTSLRDVNVESLKNLLRKKYEEFNVSG